MDMDISMDIHRKPVDMDMDMDGKFHIHGKPGPDALLRLELRAAQRIMVSKSRPNFTLLDPPVKIRGGMGENAEEDDRVDPTAEPVEYI